MVVDRPARRMSYQEAEQVIDTFYAKGGRCLYLEGGEPFLWRDHQYRMDDVVAYAQNRGYFTVIIYTNGMRPLESRANTIFISIYGLKETHDELRGETFHQIMENIRQSSHPSLYINYTINSVNRSDLEGFCEYIARFPRIKGSFFYFHTPYYGYDELFLNPVEKKEVIEELLQLKKRYKMLNSRAGVKSALRNDWKRPLDICQVYEGGTYFNCCREDGDGSVCEDCGYLSYAEIDQTLRMKPGAIANALQYF